MNKQKQEWSVWEYPHPASQDGAQQMAGTVKAVTAKGALRQALKQNPRVSRVVSGEEVLFAPVVIEETHRPIYNNAKADEHKGEPLPEHNSAENSLAIFGIFAVIAPLLVMLVVVVWAWMTFVQPQLIQMP